MQSILRIIIALLFIEHGTQKLLNFPSGPGPFPLASLMGAASIIEMLCGCFLLVGLFARLFAFIACGEMAVAYFMVHAAKSPFPVVNLGEPAVLFCFLFLFFFVAGAGSWSLDAVLWNPRRRPIDNWVGRPGPTVQAGA